MNCYKLGLYCAVGDASSWWDKVVVTSWEMCRHWSTFGIPWRHWSLLRTLGHPQPQVLYYHWQHSVNSVRM